MENHVLKFSILVIVLLLPSLAPHLYAEPTKKELFRISYSGDEAQKPFMQLIQSVYEAAH